MNCHPLLPLVRCEFGPTATSPVVKASSYGILGHNDMMDILEFILSTEQEIWQTTKFLVLENFRLYGSCLLVPYNKLVEQNELLAMY